MPSTKEKIKFRPFLVKEQKLLLMAQETGTNKDMLQAVCNIVKTCTFGKIDKPEDLLTSDIEYIFLKIRSKSVGEKVKLNLSFPGDEKVKVPTEVDLSKIIVEMDDDQMVYEKEEEPFNFGFETEDEKVEERELFSIPVIGETVPAYDNETDIIDFENELLNSRQASINSERKSKKSNILKATKNLENLENMDLADGQSLEDLKAKLKPKKTAISAEMLDRANSYDDKVAIIRMMVTDESGRVANVFKAMMQNETDIIQ